jgi:hypothetical protein
MRKAHALARALVMPDAPAGFHENPLAAGFQNEAVEAGFNPVQLIDRLMLRPESFRDNPEHRAAIPPVGTNAYEMDPNVTDCQGLQERSALHQFPAALEEIAGILDDLFALIVKVFATFH